MNKEKITTRYADLSLEIHQEKAGWISEIKSARGRFLVKLRPVKTWEEVEAHGQRIMEALVKHYRKGEENYGWDDRETGE